MKELRADAEAKLGLGAKTKESAGPTDDLLHELQVHQIELEMQNESLRQTQLALEESRDRYVDLYEFAPVGYLTLSGSGLIAEINLAGATLLGVERRLLIGRRFARFVAPADSKFWYGLLPGALQQFDRQTCELAMQRSDGSSFHARLDYMRSAGEQAAPSIRIALTDISAQKHTEEELRIAAIAFQAQEGIIVTNADGVIVRVNRAFTDLTGYSAEEAIGKTPALLKSNRQDAMFYHDMWQSLRTNGYWQGEMWNRRKDGKIYVEWLTISAVAAPNGAITHYVGTFSDITASTEAQAEIRRLAYYDPLTHLPNRRLLDDRLCQSIAQSQRAGTRVAVCYLDLDGFKDVNDRFSHEAGDQLLVEAAGRLTACVRAGDTVARIGGDEFVVLLSNLADEDECQVALDRLLRAMSVPYAVGDNVQTGISVSVGVTLFPSDPVDADTLVRHADHAMYAAKQAGKNRYQWFDTQLEQRIEARLSTLSSLAKALKLGQFRLFYQPKVNCRQGRVVGAEALIRWQHPTLGLLSPAEFLPLIEDSDLALSFGDWVLREALSQMVVWRGEGIELRVSVNAFASQLINPGLVDGLAAILEEYNEAGPGCLQIEIVETAALRGVEAIRQTIKDCEKLGITFSLDDFGTGYSTLAHLRHLPATEIKIDQSFVLNMLHRAEDLAMVESVIGLGRAFGRSIVAEGVETADHIVRLLALGCDVMQGYALARPMAAADIPRWLSEFRPDPAWAAATEMPKQSAPNREIS
jgi:diguanylate cyclase (GGDEF)-like protein/PAS domain S-box-containing protein